MSNYQRQPMTESRLKLGTDIIQVHCSTMILLSRVHLEKHVQLYNIQSYVERLDVWNETSLIRTSLSLTSKEKNSTHPYQSRMCNI